MSQSLTAKLLIERKALDLGFSGFGVCAASMPAQNQQGYKDFLAQGFHADMAWMEERVEQRSSPQGLWPEARSIIVLTANYGPDHNPLDRLKDKSKAVISAYAENLDYHDILKKRLKELGRWMQSEFGGELKVFVDTAPVLEKPLAQQAGLGWQGKHTNLVSRSYGSWLFLGEIFTTLELPPSQAEIDHCGSCSKCIDICPTGAIPQPYKLDARACLAYLSIEHKGPIPTAYRKAMGNRIYGCDDCLAVCPWNKFAQTTAEAGFALRDSIAQASLAYFLKLDDPSFRELFRKSPIKRIGRDRFVRNACIVAGNSGQQAHIALLIVLLDDASALVRGASIWALAQLLDTAEFQRLKTQKAPSETEPSVIQEWMDIA